ncbi:tyrosine-type recombinase/integrase [Saccharopolyspora mangrovi]|uniref:Site-specific integrase n=1 Tax=Saccharopolyspora mangrovi TaxID=3082379 RepID=A0ABU6A7A0_9PSEU|nr:site-specific integrase [Saccharopolyspora sp. S2-29]MEB3367437.1 site-specific integrase [Saccharopolyspora sp. S2-29]
MASIKKRLRDRNDPEKGYVWRARVYINGKEYVAHRDRKTDAEGWVDEMKAAHTIGRFVDPRSGKIPFKTYAEQWRASMGHAPLSEQAVEGILRNHVYPAIGHLPIGSVRHSALQAMVTGWGKHLGARSINTAWEHVKAVFLAAKRDRVVAELPTEGVKIPSVPHREVEIPPLAALDVLRKNLPEEYRVVVDLVVGSGLRPGEVFGLEIGARGLDSLGRRVNVCQQRIDEPRKAPYLAPLKTDASERVVPLAQVTVDALAAHLAQHPATTLAVWDHADRRRPVKREATVLFAREDQLMDGSKWSRLWRPAAKAAGLNPATGLHVLRHLYASLLIRHNESVKTVQHRLGHAKATTTLDTYGHLWDDADDTTRAAITEALTGVSTSGDIGAVSSTVNTTTLRRAD